MKIVNDLGEHELGYWAGFDSKVCVFTTPDEKAVGIEPATGVVTQPTSEVDLGVPCVRVAWKPERDDLALLAAGGTIWLSTWGGLPPHMLEVQAPARPASGELESLIYDTLIGDGEDRGFVYGEAERAECRREAKLIADALVQWSLARDGSDETCEHDLLPGHCAACKPVDA